MTIKEMLKKVDGYNEVAEMVCTEKVELRVRCGYGLSDLVKDYKSFAKYVRETYIKEIADAVLKCDKYELNKEMQFTVDGIFGDVIHSEIEFFIAIA